MISLLTMALFLFQTSADGNIRILFGLNFDQMMEKLDEMNTADLKSLTKLVAPSVDNNVVVLDSSNVGAGLIGTASQGGLTTEQINVVFCGRSQRVMAVQILMRTKQPLENAELLRQMREVYHLPDSITFDAYHPAIKYPLPGISYTEDGRWQAQSGARPVNVWSAEKTEAVFQPVAAGRTVDGQLWITDKMVAHDCAAASQD